MRRTPSNEDPNERVCPTGDTEDGKVPNVLVFVYRQKEPEMRGKRDCYYIRGFNRYPNSQISDCTYGSSTAERNTSTLETVREV